MKRLAACTHSSYVRNLGQPLTALLPDSLAALAVACWLHCFCLPTSFATNHYHLLAYFSTLAKWVPCSWRSRCWLTLHCSSYFVLCLGVPPTTYNPIPPNITLGILSFNRQVKYNLITYHLASCHFLWSWDMRNLTPTSELWILLWLLLPFWLSDLLQSTPAAAPQHLNQALSGKGVLVTKSK